MQRRERIARILVIIIALGVPGAVLSYKLVQAHLTTPRVIDISAAVPEAGGFQPNAIDVQAGETITLRFHSTDVTHGVAIGPGLGIDLGNLDPGQTKEVMLKFEQGGKYTFYCTTWCSVNHWRMRGVIQVIDPQHPNPTPQHDAVIDALATQGVDIDSDVMATPEPLPDSLFVGHASGQQGQVLIDKLNVPGELRDLAWRRLHAPVEALHLLARLNPSTGQADLENVVTYLWTGDASPKVLADTAALYNRNCAACHGENGDGKGPNAANTRQPPAKFSDIARMASRRSDVLYAKIRRGGMGTDMPNFGTIFTPDETWALVDYLWALALQPR